MIVAREVVAIRAVTRNQFFTLRIAPVHTAPLINATRLVVRTGAEPHRRLVDLLCVLTPLARIVVVTLACTLQASLLIATSLVARQVVIKRFW